MTLEVYIFFTIQSVINYFDVLHFNSIISIITIEKRQLFRLTIHCKIIVYYFKSLIRTPIMQGNLFTLT